jgi:hypothetical protein
MSQPHEHAAELLANPDLFEEAFQRGRQMSWELGRPEEDEDEARRHYRNALEEMRDGDLTVEVFSISEPVLRDSLNLNGAYNPHCPLRDAFRLGGFRGFFGVLNARRS